MLRVRRLCLRLRGSRGRRAEGSELDRCCGGSGVFRVVAPGALAGGSRCFGPLFEGCFAQVFA